MDTLNLPVTGGYRAPCISAPACGSGRPTKPHKKAVSGWRRLFMGWAPHRGASNLRWDALRLFVVAGVLFTHHALGHSTAYRSLAGGEVVGELLGGAKERTLALQELVVIVGHCAGD